MAPGTCLFSTNSLSYSMIVSYKTWDIDLEKMICRNRNNHFEVTFKQTSATELIGTVTACDAWLPSLFEAVGANPLNLYRGMIMLTRYIFAREYFKGTYNPYAVFPIELKEIASDFV